MNNYLSLMGKILDQGELRKDRTRVGTRSLFGQHLDFDLSAGFPAVTTKKLFFRGVVAELLWMMSGSKNVKPLQEQGVHIWDEWANEDGDLGPVYGSQWRSWTDSSGDIDQLQVLIDGLAKTPYSRRHILSAWNVAQIEDMALPPCHVLAQFYVGSIQGVNEPKLSCHMYQRSCDYFLGAPFNIAQYALLTHILSAHLGYIPGTLTISYGDVHIYLNHVSQCEEQFSRPCRNLPDLSFKRKDHWADYKTQDFKLLNYDPHPAIKGEIAV